MSENMSRDEARELGLPTPEDRYLNIDTEEYFMVLLIHPSGAVAMRTTPEDLPVSAIREVLHQVADTIPENRMD